MLVWVYTCQIPHCWKSPVTAQISIIHYKILLICELHHSWIGDLAGVWLHTFGFLVIFNEWPLDFFGDTGPSDCSRPCILNGKSNRIRSRLRAASELLSVYLLWSLCLLWDLGVYCGHHIGPDKQTLSVKQDFSVYNCKYFSCPSFLTYILGAYCYHWNGSFEYPQNMFWNKKNIFGCTLYKRQISFLIPSHLNICCGCSKERSYKMIVLSILQHILWLRDKNALLSGGMWSIFPFPYYTGDVFGVNPVEGIGCFLWGFFSALACKQISWSVEVAYGFKYCRFKVRWESL